ncbi:MAG: carbonic anhydrase [Cyanobacteriota bacterium]
MTRKNQSTSVSRRNLLKLSAGAVGTGVLTAGLGSKLAFPEPAIAQEDMTPEQALQKLMDGNKRFINGKRQSPNQTFARLQEVAKGQKPFASILSCADSRVPSEIVFDQGFGDLFICRVAGNVATPEEIGSLEYGTLVLGTKVLMVVGHKKCGAVDATIKGAQVPGQIASLIDAIKPALERSKGKTGDNFDNTVKANVLVQIDKLKESPVISQLVEEGKLIVVGGYYDLDTGEISMVS